MRTNLFLLIVLVITLTMGGSCNNEKPIVKEMSILYPIGNEVFTLGDTVTIKIKKNFENDVTYIVKQGTESTTIALSSGLNIEWVLDSAIYTEGEYTINCEYDNLNISSNTFQLVDANFIKVTSPTTTTSIENGETFEIKWNDNISENVNIELFNEDVFYKTIVNSIPNNGTYDWVLSNTINPNNNYQIKITSANDNNLFDFSDNFTILSSDTIQHTMVTEDYQVIIDYIANHSELYVYLSENYPENTEYYYGVTSYYGNFDMQLTKRRDHDPSGFLDGMTDAEAQIEIENRIPEAINIFLQSKFPSAQPISEGVQYYYSVQYQTFNSTKVLRDYTAIYKCTGIGVFEYIETNQIN